MGHDYHIEKIKKKLNREIKVTVSEQIGVECLFDGRVLWYLWKGRLGKSDFNCLRLLCMKMKSCRWSPINHEEVYSGWRRQQMKRHKGRLQIFMSKSGA